MLFITVQHGRPASSMPFTNIAHVNLCERGDRSPLRFSAKFGVSDQVSDTSVLVQKSPAALLGPHCDRKRCLCRRWLASGLQQSQLLTLATKKEQKNPVALTISQRLDRIERETLPHAADVRR
jgi:hypothetical protein